MLEYFKKLAEDYHVSLDNVLSIALNRYGIILKETTENRLRFNLQFNEQSSKNYFAVCVNTYLLSPFELKGNILFLENEEIAQVSDIEKDTCTATYFRNNKKVITFNSNSRSKCAGCKFCGTYSLSEDDSYDFSQKENVINYFQKLLKANNINGMENIENVTICTGCFNNEDALIDHLLVVNSAFKDMNFSGSLNYIGSQLRDYSKIKELAKTINNFGLYLTIEKFLDREKFMRLEKSSLTLEKAKNLLEYCSSLGLTTTFLYILGLDPLEAIEKYFIYFKDSINKFPIIQVFQDYTEEQEKYRIEDAKDIEYYLKARKILDKTYSNLDKKLWECFRSLYFTDDSNKLEIKR